MAVTLTANYKETLKAETVELIDELIEDNHGLSCILEFIDENDEDTFVTYYEEYVEQGEKVGYDIVDAFVKEEGFCDVEHCEDAYVGTYRDTDAFVEELIEQEANIPAFVIVDLKDTWFRSLAFDYNAVDGGSGMVHIFRKYY